MNNVFRSLLLGTLAFSLSGCSGIHTLGDADKNDDDLIELAYEEFVEKSIPFQDKLENTITSIQSFRYDCKKYINRQLDNEEYINFAYVGDGFDVTGYGGIENIDAAKVLVPIIWALYNYPGFASGLAMEGCDYPIDPAEYYEKKSGGYVYKCSFATFEWDSMGLLTCQDLTDYDEDTGFPNRTVTTFTIVY